MKIFIISANFLAFGAKDLVGMRRWCINFLEIVVIADQTPN